MGKADNRSFVASIAARYGPRLRRFLSVRLRNAADVPDLAQEVFLRLLRVEGGESIRSPEAYLFTVASHVIHQHAMRRASEPISVDIAEVFSELRTVSSDDPSDQAAYAQRLEELERVLVVFGTNFVPNGSVLTNPPASFNSQPFIYLSREDDRYNAAFLAHDDVTDYFQPYAEFYFMDDRTHQQIAPSALFKDLNPLDPLSGNYNVNCNNPFLSAQEQSILCTPAQIAAANAAPAAGCTFTQTPTGPVMSPNCVNVRIGRRNVEGGGRISDYEHQNFRPVFGAKGNFADAWSYDVYGQYYYTTFFNSNQKYQNFQSIDNALQVNGTAAAPTCVSGPPCVPYNIFADGGVTQQQLNYLY